MTKKRWIIAAVIVLVGLRLALPEILRWKINKTLADLPNYKGHVSGLHLAMWRCACVLRDVEIEHKDGDFGLTIQKLSLNASWAHILKKTWVGDVDIVSPRLRVLVKEPGKAPKEAAEKAKDLEKDVKKKTGKSLPDLLGTLIPFKIREFTLQDGTLRLQDLAKDSAKEARVSNLEIKASNLTNRAELSSSTFANVEASAKLMEHGKFTLDLRLNPNARTPHFDLRAEITDLNLVELNPLFRWQWGIDVKKGIFTMLAESKAQEGRFQGYVKPFIKDLEFHDHEQDKKKSLGKKVKEAIADVAAAILKNDDSKNIASRIPFEGAFDNPDPGIWEAVITILQNAFIKALSPHFEQISDV